MKNLSLKEVARRFDVHPDTVRRWIRDGRFPNAYKLTPHGLTSPYRIPESDVVEFERQQREATLE